jgi:hypothetical protein
MSVQVFFQNKKKDGGCQDCKTDIPECCLELKVCCRILEEMTGGTFRLFADPEATDKNRVLFYEK